MLISKVLPEIDQRLRCLGESATLLQGAALLDEDCDMVVVCDPQGRMAGVLTKSDAVGKMGQCSGSSCTAPVAEAMTREVIAVTPDHQMKDCWEIMKGRGLKNIPITDAERRPLGVLNARDVLQSLWEDVQHEENLLFNYVMNIGYR